ncbi:Latrophilin-like protein LAT-2 [Geodia barretti]|uniref:Latrophilin-like protein LAT-2 n=1 Tax=Geodia barretti TaxID=519541 RepID=A0AA35VZR0_GEOBA|nr:Latrophilin-like protein LAT-2 [Geodia barretti]
MRSQTARHATGNATRECSLTGSWGVANVMSCLSEEIALVQEEAKCLEDAEERIQCAVNISVQLAEASLAVSTKRGPNTSIYPLDLQTINGIVSRVLNVFEDERREVSSEALVDVFNNSLREANQAGWTQLQTAGSGSQALLKNAERFGRILATSTVNGNGTLVLSRQNIVVAAEVVKGRVSNFSFPAQPDQLGNFSRDNNETVSVSIPEDSLKRLTKEAEVYLVNTIFRNIKDFLPINTSVLSNGKTESLVISTQFGALDQEDSPNDTFKDSPITFNFSFRASSDTGSKYAGVFWDFSNPVNKGGWSLEGIQVISSVTRDNVTTVVFNSTHLTSFAVLVDVAGGLEGTPKEELLALKIFSYIGCAISTVCLFITVLFYLAMGKKLFSAIHYFVHLNLAISLLLGYLVFVLGIELGNSNKVACGFVAALLQYLFLSAFCWMMCEGIMLYLMLIVVFSRLSKKWWFFMIVGYCTPLLFVASGLAARVEHYGVYGDDGELAL